MSFTRAEPALRRLAFYTALKGGIVHPAVFAEYNEEGEGSLGSGIGGGYRLRVDRPVAPGTTLLSIPLPHPSRARPVPKASNNRRRLRRVAKSLGKGRHDHDYHNHDSVVRKSESHINHSYRHGVGSVSQGDNPWFGEANWFDAYSGDSPAIATREVTGSNHTDSNSDTYNHNVLYDYAHQFPRLITAVAKGLYQRSHPQHNYLLFLHDAYNNNSGPADGEEDETYGSGGLTDARGLSLDMRCVPNGPYLRPGTARFGGSDSSVLNDYETILQQYRGELEADHNMPGSLSLAPPGVAASAGISLTTPTGRAALAYCADMLSTLSLSLPDYASRSAIRWAASIVLSRAIIIPRLPSALANYYHNGDHGDRATAAPGRDGPTAKIRHSSDLARSTAAARRSVILLTVPPLTPAPMVREGGTGDEREVVPLLAGIYNNAVEPTVLSAAVERYGKIANEQPQHIFALLNYFNNNKSIVNLLCDKHNRRWPPSGPSAYLWSGRKELALVPILDLVQHPGYCLECLRQEGSGHSPGTHLEHDPRRHTHYNKATPLAWLNRGANTGLAVTMPPADIPRPEQYSSIYKDLVHAYRRHRSSDRRPTQEEAQNGFYDYLSTYLSFRDDRLRWLQRFRRGRLVGRWGMAPGGRCADEPIQKAVRGRLRRLALEIFLFGAPCGVRGWRLSRPTIHLIAVRPLAAGEVLTRDYAGAPARGLGVGGEDIADLLSPQAAPSSAGRDPFDDPALKATADLWQARYGFVPWR